MSIKRPHRRRDEKRWAVLISGRGSNLGALLDLRDEVDLRLVVSSTPSAFGLTRAKRAGVPTRIVPYLPPHPSSDPLSGLSDDNALKKPADAAKNVARKIDWPKLDHVLRDAQITHLFLAGFMKVIPASFVSQWPRRILNLHPSLLPLYPGLHSIERAFEAKQNIGLTVHEVTAEVDAGQIVLQRQSLKRLTNHDSLEAVEFQVHVDEQRAVREAIRRWNC